MVRLPIPRLFCCLLMLHALSCTEETTDPPAQSGADVGGGPETTAGFPDSGAPAADQGTTTDPPDSEDASEKDVEPPDAGAPTPETGSAADVPKDCTDTCPYADAQGCDGAAVVVCALDDDTGCLKWLPPVPCDDGLACTQDACKGAGVCYATSIPNCQTGCEACPYECKAGKCVTCKPGETQCQDDTMTQCTADGTTMALVSSCPSGCTVGPQGAECAQCPAGESTCLNAQTAALCLDPIAGWTTDACMGSFEKCVDGECIGILAWSVGDDEADTQVWLMLHAAACAMNPPGLCWLMDTTNLKTTLSVAALATWFCGQATEGLLSANDFLPVESFSETDLFETALGLLACGGGEETLSIDSTEGMLAPGKPLGEYCMSHVAGPVATVQVAECPPAVAEP